MHECLSVVIDGALLTLLHVLKRRVQLSRFYVALVYNFYLVLSGTAVARWLRCCATNCKVTGLIRDGVIGISLRHNPSDRTMPLGSTQPLTEMSTRSISWG